MSRIYYAMEQDAPVGGVWFLQCDVCRGIGDGPAASHDALKSLEDMNAEGWRCLSNATRDAHHESTGVWLPWDTCPDDLATEGTP